MLSQRNKLLTHEKEILPTRKEILLALILIQIFNQNHLITKH